MQDQRDDLSKERRNETSWYWYYLAIFITGGGIGWLTGLSVSPTVSIVITSITGSAAAIVAAMSGIEKKVTDPSQSKNKEKTEKQWGVNSIPLAVLVIGLIVGSILGILARTNNLLGSDINVSAQIEKWSALGIAKEDIARRLFDIEFPVNSQSSSSSGKGTQPTLGVLFTVSSDQCETLRAASIRAEVADPDALVNELRRIESLKNLPDIVEDPELLKSIVEEVICPEN